MKPSNLPPIQGMRFDFETLQDNVINLMKHANKGPTYLRKAGRVTHVVMTEEQFNELWPDRRRVWSTDETPDRLKDRLIGALAGCLAEDQQTKI